jgi:hypothetical protein
MAEFANLAKGRPFEEFYPNVPDDYFESLAATLRTRAAGSPAGQDAETEIPEPVSAVVTSLEKMGALKMVVNMHRSRFYEGHVIPEDKVTNHYLQGISPHERGELLKELVQMEILHRHGKGGGCTYSLNKKSHAIIEAAVARFQTPPTAPKSPGT